MLTNTQKKLMRQEKILLSLSKLGFATRAQLQKIHDLGKTRNANRILYEMREYLNHFRLGEEGNVYYLNQKGLDLLGISGKPLNKNMQYEHTLMKNDMYIYFGCPKDWALERPIHFKMKEDLGGVIVTKEKTIIPDARFTKNGLYHFVEVDHQQQMKENLKKIKLYKGLSSSIKEQFKQTPAIIFYTTTENRKKKLDEWCDREELYYQVLSKKDIL
jgi:Replication-relaxation